MATMADHWILDEYDRYRRPTERERFLIVHGGEEALQLDRLPRGPRQLGNRLARMQLAFVQKPDGSRCRSWVKWWMHGDLSTPRLKIANPANPITRVASIRRGLL